MSNTGPAATVDWTRQEREEVAVDRLLDAAGRAFAELGVSRATMVDIAHYAGCSRATLYRYFQSRRALHLAYVNRAALGIAVEIGTTVASNADPAAVLTDRILAGIRAVRADPLLAVWFTPENMAVPIALSRDSDVLAALAAQFTEGLDLPAWNDIDLNRRAAWLLRSIVSLLAMPTDDDDEEHAIVERFVVPPLITGHPPSERRP